ncbi:uncharacterized protein LOC132726026 [Ruditapes philippinarum]|uniref:uncharacterized protein LOC132726026 n=1 Tax=Ruditapes philippinarum TaxID=129788 RepID=UPI00295B3F48|nr:uncharacterized protein LOC132726026 [Ruditapes philippinarum]
MSHPFFVGLSVVLVVFLILIFAFGCALAWTEKKKDPDIATERLLSLTPRNESNSSKIQRSLKRPPKTYQQHGMHVYNRHDEMPVHENERVNLPDKTWNNRKSQFCCGDIDGLFEIDKETDYLNHRSSYINSKHFKSSNDYQSLNRRQGDTTTGVHKTIKTNNKPTDFQRVHYVNGIETDAGRVHPPRRKLSVKQMVEEAKRIAQMGQQHETGFTLNSCTVNTQASRSKEDIKLPKNQSTSYRPVELNVNGQDIHRKRPSEKQNAQLKGSTDDSFVDSNGYLTLHGNEYPFNSYDHESLPSFPYHRGKENYLSQHDSDGYAVDTSLDGLSEGESISNYTQSPKGPSVKRDNETVLSPLSNRQLHSSEKLSLKAIPSKRTLDDSSDKVLPPEINQESSTFDDLFTSELKMGMEQVARDRAFQQQSPKSKLRYLRRMWELMHRVFPSFISSKPASNIPYDRLSSQKSKNIPAPVPGLPPASEMSPRGSTDSLTSVSSMSTNNSQQSPASGMSPRGSTQQQTSVSSMSPNKSQQSPTSVSAHEHVKVSEPTPESELSTVKEISPEENIKHKTPFVLTRIKQLPKSECTEKLYHKNENHLFKSMPLKNKKEQSNPDTDTEQQATDINCNQEIINAAANEPERKIQTTHASIPNEIEQEYQSVNVIHNLNNKNTHLKLKHNEDSKNHQMTVISDNVKAKQTCQDTSYEQQSSDISDGTKKQITKRSEYIQTREFDSSREMVHLPTTPKTSPSDNSIDNKLNKDVQNHDEWDSIVTDRKDLEGQHYIDNVLSESDFNPGKTSTPQKSGTDFLENEAISSINSKTLPSQQIICSNTPSKGNSPLGNGPALHSILKKRRGAIAGTSKDISRYNNGVSFWDDKNAEETLHDSPTEEQPKTSTPKQSGKNVLENEAISAISSKTLPTQQDITSNSPSGNSPLGKGRALHSILKKCRGAIAGPYKDISRYINEVSFRDDKNAEETLHDSPTEEQPKTSTPKQSGKNVLENVAISAFKSKTLPSKHNIYPNRPSKGNSPLGNGPALHSILKKYRGEIHGLSNDLSRYYNEVSFWEDENENAKEKLHDIPTEQPNTSVHENGFGMLSPSLSEKIAMVKCIKDDPDVSALLDNIKGKRRLNVQTSPA